jgi:hypothetical protein
VVPTPSLRWRRGNRAVARAAVAADAVASVASEAGATVAFDAVATVATDDGTGPPSAPIMVVGRLRV